MSKAKDKAKQKAGGKKGGGKNKPPPAAPTDDQSIAGIYGNKGVNAGNALMNKFLPGDSPLGRVSTDVPGAEQIGQRNQALLGATGASAGETESLANMKAGLGGYTSPEYQAQREQMQRGINSNMATGMASLAKAQARGKVYGAAAGAQQQNAITAAQNQEGQLEQDLNIKNIDEMRSRNEAYGKASGEQNQAAFNRQNVATQNYNKDTQDLGNASLDREKINLGQADAETAARIGLFTGGGATSISNEQTRQAQDIERQGIAAINGQGGRTPRGNFGGGGGVEGSELAYNNSPAQRQQNMPPRSGGAPIKGGPPSGTTPIKQKAQARASRRR